MRIAQDSKVVARYSLLSLCLDLSACHGARLVVDAHFLVFDTSAVRAPWGFKACVM